MSALDKSVEAQVLNLLVDLKELSILTYLFISHDLNVVQYISDRVLVMYLGRWWRWARWSRSTSARLHPYTQALLAIRPSMDPRTRSTTAADRRSAEPDQPALRLPLPYPVPPRGCGLCGGGAGTRPGPASPPHMSAPGTGHGMAGGGMTMGPSRRPRVPVVVSDVGVRFVNRGRTV